MTLQQIRRFVVSTAIAAAVAGALLVVPAMNGLAGPAAPGIPSASAASCPAVEVIFARGRLEPAGAGQIGNAFVSALRQKSGKNVNLYAVRYPADTQIDVGANDMSARVQSTMATCPDTKIVLGGYSLGAAVTDVAMAVPFAFFGFDNPLPAGADQHVAAVALFGNGSQWVGPITNFNPVYNDRTIEMCHPDDPICNPTQPDNWEADWPNHLAPAYIKAGMVDQAAGFVAGKV